MSLSPMDVAKLLVIQEEQGGLKSSIDNLNTTLKQQGQQPVKAPTSTSVKEGKTKHFTKTLENFNTHGTVFTTDKDVHIKLLKLKTSTEFKNFTIFIENQTYISGDFSYMQEIGFAYYNPETSLYVINLSDEHYPGGVDITIDKGINIKLLSVIGSLKV